MEHGYVLIHFDDAMKKAVLAQLKKIHGITDIIDLEKHGELLIKVESASIEHLRSIIVWKVQKMTCVDFVSPLSKNKNYFL